MELYPDDVERLQRLLEEWTAHDTRELEATFSGASDMTTFMAVAQRLKARKFEALPQEDKLNIVTPEQIRFTLTGMAAIESYCRDDRIDGKPFEVMRKDRAGVESNVDIADYGLRVKVRREVLLSPTDPAVLDIVKRWSSQRKAFRIMRRYTFMGKGVRFDLSMVRSTTRDKKGQFEWQRSFSDQDITRSRPEFELEVELLRPTPEEMLGKTVQEVAQAKMKHLIAGIGEVLRGIQKHHLILRKSTVQRVLAQYKELVGSPLFRGVAPYGMVKENMMKARREGIPNIRDGYNVTDKADGLRMMGFVDEGGELFMIDMSMSVYRTGLQRLALANSLVDGEYVTRDIDGNPITQFLLFDIYIAPNKQDMTKVGFAPADGNGRMKALNAWSDAWNEGSGPQIVQGAGVTEKTKITVRAKKFLVAAPGDREIFTKCGQILASAGQVYHTDGLILTPNEKPIPEAPGTTWSAQLKWKPAEENTVDFLVLLDKEEDQDLVITGVKPGPGQENIRYKVMRLYVGSSSDPAYANPRGTILFEQPLPGARGGRREYKPVLFNPSDYGDTMAAVCYGECHLDPLTEDDFIKCENDDPIQDRTIVEFRYDLSEPPGWRWKPLRVRHDKTERFQRGQKGRLMNKDETAEGVWNSIHDPITHHMITTGSEVPSVSEQEHMQEGGVGVAVNKVYYDRRAPREDSEIIKGLRNFHRLYIKDEILLGRGLRGGGKTLVDLACGQGGDMNTWWDSKCDFVYGTDIAGDGITNPVTGIYKRYIKNVMRAGGYEKGPKMIFTIGTSALNLATGEAGATPEESNIMRAVYGKVAPDGPIPPFVQKYGQGRLREGADCVAIMFAIHYFFENEATLEGFIQNVNDSLRVGGLFVGCCFDGQKVFDTLRGLAEGGSLVGQEPGGAEIWKITKRYSAEDLTNGPESLGLPIDVEFMSIGTEQREYLVPFKLLEAKMKQIGCDLLTESECRELGLRNSTNMFEETYAMASAAGKKYPMSPVVKQYSFFNRWFIFKRRRGGKLGVEEAVAEEVAEEGLAQPQVQVVEKRSVFETPAERAAAREEAMGAATVKPATKAAAPPPPSVTPAATAAGRTFTLKQVFAFASDAPPIDKLKIGDPNAARWISPFAPVPVVDNETGEEYPSIEHFLGAMKYKLATNKPELAPLLFGKAGTIRQEFARQRLAETKQGTQALTQAREDELLVLERAMILEESGPKGFKRHKATFDPTRWATVLDRVLEDAYRQRWEKDGQLRKIVEAARAQKLHLIYTGKGIPELAGKRTAEGRIEGENRLGELLMRLV